MTIAADEPDLAKLLEELESPVVDAQLITRLRSRSGSCYRVRLANDRVVKGRQLASSRRAKTVHELAGYLPDVGVPRVLARQGRALLSQWVDGEPISSVDLDENLLVASGELHGRIHAAELTEGRWRLRTTASKYTAHRVASALEELEEAELITPAEADQAIRLASQCVPESFDVGISHGDFCAENLLVDSAGQIVVVDNETLAIGPLDYDLARTWYRWPMTEHQRTAYYEGYRRWRDPAAFRRNAAYWTVMALAEAAIYRLSAVAEQTDVPVDRLRSLLRGGEQFAD